MKNDKIKWVDDARNSISYSVCNPYKIVNNDPRVRYHNV